MKLLSCARIVSIFALLMSAAAPPEAFGADQYPPPGKLIDIGGRKLHLNCTGRAKTLPTVVVENGAGAFSLDWALVQPEVAKFGRICTYDRAGYGWSDPGPAFDTVEQTVSDLHSLLRKAKIRPPYVLVGASLGGLFIRMYQTTYPSEVEGMVLVDAAHEDGNFMRVDGKATTISSLLPEKLHDVISQLRESLLKNPPPPPPIPTTIEAPYDKLPADLQPVRVWLDARFQQQIADFLQHLDARTVAKAFADQESLGLATIALHKARAEHDFPLGDLPLIVLSRTLNTDDRRKEWQNGLARLSRKGTHIWAENSDHEIHLFRPDLVIQAVRDLLQPAKH